MAARMSSRNIPIFANGLLTAVDLSPSLAVAGGDGLRILPQHDCCLAGGDAAGGRAAELPSRGQSSRPCAAPVFSALVMLLLLAVEAGLGARRLRQLAAPHVTGSARGHRAVGQYAGLCQTRSRTACREERGSASRS